MSTPLAFAGEPSAETAFATGRLDIRADDGSRILLDADGGSGTGVTVSITDPRGDAVGEFVLPWSTWADSLRL